MRIKIEAMLHNEEREIPVIQRIERLYDRIDSVKDLSYKVNNQHKYDYYEYMRMLIEKRLQLEMKLQELKGSSANTYDDIKTSVEIKVAELSIVLQQIKERFYQ